jgi:hypothetical protein
MKGSLFFSCAVAAAVVVISAIAADVPPSTPADAVKQLESLLQERRDTLRKIVEYVQAQEKTGAFDLPDAIRVSNELIEAELELATSKAQRIALQQKFVANLKRIEQFLQRSAEVGRGTDATKKHLEAKAARLKAEIQLAREKLGEK